MPALSLAILAPRRLTTGLVGVIDQVQTASLGEIERKLRALETEFELVREALMAARAEK